MKKNILFVLVVFSVLCFLSCKNSPNQLQKEESVYSKVISNGKIRAAYITYPPALIKDTKTGKLSGIFAEVLEKAAENLGLEVEWTEEIGWGSQIEALNANRCDIIGSPVWANPTRGKLTTLSIPVYFSGIGVYVRADDNRFDSDYSVLNNELYRIATIDGETADLIARSDFPNAKRVSLTQLSSIAEVFLNVGSNKADVAFAEPFYGHEFLKNNPGQIKNIASKKPIRNFGNCYMLKKDEFQLKHMLDVAIQDLLNSGFVDRVIDKYEPYPNTFYRVALQYKVD